MKPAVAAGLLVALTAPASADWPSSWHEPTAPFHVVGNIYYVGSKGLASYLITSPEGAILLDGTLAENVPAIERNIASLGFTIRDVKILLNTHAHFDHAAGLARLKADSEARLFASAGDKPILESGHLKVENSNDLPDFAPVRVDRTLRDNEVVRLGPIVMRAILTPGHTPGCTSWTTIVRDHGRSLRVVFPCSITTAGNRLIGNMGYRGIVADYRRSFARLGALHADVVLTAHPEIADVQGRAARRRDDGPDAYIAPKSLHEIVAAAQRDFERDLLKEKAAAR
ncbi:MAG TPA: subclass B3 metallo-beta-lactamase [Sphingomonas sp.]|nr:subclass B3 metallo-beta-lactamase [Sphingomonas sp.]